MNKSEQKLRELSYAGIQKRYPFVSGDELQKIYERTEYELSVIFNMGFADYLLIVQDFLNFGKKAGHLSYESNQYLLDHMKEMTLDEMIAYVDTHQEEPSLAIGKGRGSAAGSIVCYEIGITDIDPIRYDLMFERFLNPERVSMPDIDSDFSFEVREVCIEYCRKVYGENAVCGINTVTTASAKAAIRLTGRALAAEQCVGKSNDQSEIIKKEFLALVTKINKLIPNTPGIMLSDVEEEVKAKLADLPLAIKIFDTAKLIEGCATNTGTHAAGIIIGDRAISDYVALSYDTENHVYKVQCDMGNAEGTHKLLKMDFLGLRTLSIVTKTLRLIKKNRGIIINPDEIPFEPEVFKYIYANGNTNGIFQFESAFMKQTLKQFNPSSIDDIILINAVGRPGPMEYIPKIVASKKKLETVEYLIPEMEPLLLPTYGYPVYQEQVMALVQLSGRSMGEADNVRRFMSKKKMDKLEKEGPKFIEGMVARGADRAKTTDYWTALLDFGKYGFNKSHAACYSILSYITAWLKYHYPAEFICATMEFSDIVKYPALIQDAKNAGVEVLPPSVNTSEFELSVTNHNGKDAILFGIGSIKGCGEALKSEIHVDETFQTFAELIYKKRKFNKSVIKMLIDSGACDCFSDNREAMRQALTAYSLRLDEIKKVEKSIAQYELQLQILTENDSYFSSLPKNDDSWRNVFEEAGVKIKNKNIPIASKLITSLNKKKEQLNSLVDDFFAIQIGECYEDRRQRLELEKEATGFYISEHPVDSYEKPVDAINIDDIDNGTVRIYGMIKELSVKQRKKDGKPLAFFELEDSTGSVQINCWTNEYEQYSNILQDGAVVIIEGQANITEEEFEDAEGVIETKRIVEVSLKNIEPAKQKAITEKPIVLTFNSNEEWDDFKVKKSVGNYITEKGSALYVSINNMMFPMNCIVHSGIKVAYTQWLSEKTVG